MDSNTEKKSHRFYISSPTEDLMEKENSEKEDIQEMLPNFADLKGVLDFNSEFKEQLTTPLLIYILRGEISSINIANVNYILQIFFTNESRLYAAYKDKNLFQEEQVKKFLENRETLIKEIKRELGL